MKKIVAVISLWLITTANAASEIKAVVSILPIKYIVQRIGGDCVSVSSLVGQGQNPELYEPQPRQVAALSNANIYYQIGLPFERTWIKKIRDLNFNIVVVDLRKDIQFIYNDGVPDPHIWTSPVVAKQVAKNIKDSLVMLDVGHKNFYLHNYYVLINDLEQLDKRIKLRLAGIKSRAFLVFHPTWGYFAKYYGLKQLAVEIEGKESGPQDLMKVIREIHQQKLKVVFVQPQFGNAKAKALADTLHLKIDILDPLSEDYIENLYIVAEKIALWGSETC